MALGTKVRDTIHKYKMLANGDGLLVAVSGGSDSVALIHLLSGLKGELGLRLEMAHLQHGIRGEEARQDALFVADLAARLSIPLHLKNIDLPGMRSEHGKGNLEAMAREERYRFFVATAEKHNLGKIATAHTRDDQVETLLMWLLRGSGKKGLSGIPPVRQLIPDRGETVQKFLLVRPFIEVSRKEIIDHLSAQNLEYRTDRTNLDPGPQRNWLRLRLLPQLRERMDPHLDERLSHLADLFRDEEEILERIAREDLQEVLNGESFLCESLLGRDKAIQRRLIRLWFKETFGDLKGIGYRHVEEVLQFIDQGPPQGRLSIPGGWNLVRSYGSIRLEKKIRQKVMSYSYTLPCDGELVISEAGMKIRSSRGFCSPNARPQNRWEALFDLAMLPKTLTVRNFRAGDRFQPLGMQGHKKVKDLFIEKRVPLSVRASLPLILAGSEVLWIPQYGRSEVAKVGPETREVLRIKLNAQPGKSVPWVY